MLRYTAQRILWIAPVMLGVASVTFLLMHFVPGGPWDQQKPLSQEVVQNLNARYGLDDPLWKQYLGFLYDGLRGDLGVSYTKGNRQVTDIIRQGFPPTATLAGLAFLITIGVGVPLGTVAAIRRNSPVDYLVTTVTTALASIPGFVLGILLVILFSLSPNPPKDGLGDSP